MVQKKKQKLTSVSKGTWSNWKITLSVLIQMKVRTKSVTHMLTGTTSQMNRFYLFGLYFKLVLKWLPYI